MEEEEQSLVFKCSISAVFNNLDIVEKILEGVTDDVRSNMELRLVNRMFRDAYHVNLRRTHRNLKIENIKGRISCYQDYGLKEEFITTDQIYINQCRFNISNLNNYFHFLKNIAKVKIESIVVKGFWQVSPFIRLILHESIKLYFFKTGGDSLKKLIGMDEISFGNSVLIPEECVEYGPLRIGNLQKSFTKPRVFDKLIVPDYLLDDIANVCIQSTQSKDDCLNAISGLIPSNISCKTLILKISEQRNEWINPEWNNEMQERLRTYPIPDHQPMPREVIEVMLKQWNVQSVVLKFVCKHHRKEHAGEWTRKGWLTKLCFKDPYFNIKKSDRSFKINEVLVDLTDSLESNVHLARSYVYSIDPSYVDLPSKIRRVFLNDKLKIQFSHYRTQPYGRISDVVDSLMKRIDAEAPRNLEVEIMNLYLSWKNDIDYFDELSKKEPDERPAVYNAFYNDFYITKLPNQINVSQKTLGHEIQPFVKEDWTGRCFQLINEKRNRTINWAILENNVLLEKNHKIL
ncbi:unnamed protein product [Caenorhabditis brenneri]